MTSLPSHADQNRIAFVQACWHREIVDQARDAFLESIEVLGYAPDQVDLFEVPGTLEIPLQAKRLAETGRFAAIVALQEEHGIDQIGRREGALCHQRPQSGGTSCATQAGGGKAAGSKITHSGQISR